MKAEDIRQGKKARMERQEREAEAEQLEEQRRVAEAAEQQSVMEKAVEQQREDAARPSADGHKGETTAQQMARQNASCGYSAI